MDQQLLKDYADAKWILSEATMREQTLKAAIRDEMLKAGTDREDTIYGTFSIARRASWKYTKKVKDLKVAAELLEIEEREKDIAEKTITEYVLFKAN